MTPSGSATEHKHKHKHKHTQTQEARPFGEEQDKQDRAQKQRAAIMQIK